MFLEYISYATTEQQPDRIRMDLLLKAMKVWMPFLSPLCAGRFLRVCVCVCVSPFNCLSAALSVCLSVCLSACNCFVLLSACDCLSVCSQIVGSHSAILLLSWLSLVSFRVVIFVIQHLSVFSVWSLWWQRLPQHPNPRPNRKAKFRFSPLYTGPTFLSNSTYLSLQLLFCKSQFKSLDLWYARWRLLLALIYLSGNGVHY